MVQNIRAFAVAAAIIFSAGGQATKEIPAPLRAPADQQLYLQVHAQGAQIYTCKNESGQFNWSFKGPEAQLTEKGKPFGKHFAGPSWQSNDGSLVTGKVTGKVDSEDAQAIPWLLLNVESHEGEGILSRAKTIQRVNTKGGKAPTSGCDADHVNQETRVAYTAEYNFYAAK